MTHPDFASQVQAIEAAAAAEQQRQQETRADRIHVARHHEAQQAAIKADRDRRNANFEGTPLAQVWPPEDVQTAYEFLGLMESRGFPHITSLTRSGKDVRGYLIGVAPHKMGIDPRRVSGEYRSGILETKLEPKSESLRKAGHTSDEIRKILGAHVAKHRVEIDRETSDEFEAYLAEEGFERAGIRAGLEDDAYLCVDEHGIVSLRVGVHDEQGVLHEGGCLYDDDTGHPIAPITGKFNYRDIKQLMPYDRRAREAGLTPVHGQVVEIKGGSTAFIAPDKLARAIEFQPLNEVLLKVATSSSLGNYPKIKDHPPEEPPKKTTYLG